jgi:primosomal protein N'
MTSTNVITFEQLTSRGSCSAPTLVLRPPKSEQRAKYFVPVFLTEDHWNSELEETKRKIDNLEQDGSAQEKENNIKKMEKIFDEIGSKFQQKLNRMKADTRKNMANMTINEQNELIIFWKGVGSFFSQLLDWIMDMFQKIVDLVKKGWRMAKDIVAKIFDPVIAFMKEVYNSISQ